MAKKRSPSKRPRKNKNQYDKLVAWGIVASLLIIGLLLWGPFRAAKRTLFPKQAKPAQQAPGEPEAKKPETKHPGKLVVVAIVIDDLGQDLKSAQEVLELPEKVTLSVMPGLPQSGKVAEIARQYGRELLLHIPMEPKSHAGKRQSPGTLRSDMTPMEFISAVTSDIESVPGAVGVNNHEGSALTENREAMHFLMSELKSRNLFFLDSLTSPASVAHAAAREFGLKAAKRDVFLDNENNNPAAIRRQLDELSRIAKKHGSAIAIGHPHAATLSELKKWLATAAEEGIEVVPVSHLVK
jgi:hypothetical protein